MDVHKDSATYIALWVLVVSRIFKRDGEDAEGIFRRTNFSITGNSLTVLKYSFERLCVELR